MKYKVILYNDGSAAAVDNAGSFSFYTRSQATEFVQSWRELAGTFGGYLWDGSTWTTYPPIP